MDGKVYLARRRNLLGEPQINFSIQRYRSYYSIYPVTQFFSSNFSRHLSYFHLLTFIYTKSSSSRDQLPYITITWSTAVYHEKNTTSTCYRVEYTNSDRINQHFMSHIYRLFFCDVDRSYFSYVFRF